MQETFYDWWQEYWSRQPFPSGYTQSSITLLACLITTIIFLIVVGNCLVCIAIFTEKSLKPTQNWFIASLAVSDMLLGLVVMPFSLARELMGFWVFGPLWCDIHEAVDVLLTTASINTLCLISLDRYWSITQAVNYLKKRTPRRGAFMIAFVWVFSAAVSLPPLFGWKKQSPSLSNAPPPQNTSKPATAATNPNATDPLMSPINSAAAEQDLDSLESRRQAQDYEDVPAASQHANWRRKRRRDSHLDQAAGGLPDERSRHLMAAREQREQQAFYAKLLMQQQPVQPASTPAPMIVGSSEYPVCQLSDDIGYVLYSAFGSFFIPCGVMVFTYIKIFLAARSRARRAINKQSRGATGAADKAKQRNTSANQQQLQRRTISGQTGGGRVSKQLGNAASTALLVDAAEADEEEALAGGRMRRADSLAKQQQQVIANEFEDEFASNRRKQSVVRGKLVLVERRKSIAAQGQQQQQQQQLEAETCATLTTSGAQLATASALQPNDSGQQASALITVMSESMADLPVTRFEFKQQRSKATPEAIGKSGDNNKVATLLKAISHASDTVEKDQLMEILDEQESDSSQKQRAAELSGPSRRQECNVIDDAEPTEASMPNNSTNETCFMTIEEDSDNLEAQTGRTIMMVASNARSPLPSAAKAQGITMTMLPPARIPADTTTESNSATVICNNVACLRRQRQRAARAASSYCGSSMTINDEEEEEEEDEEVGEEEEEDECLEDDLLTDDCNGYSNSCGLDPECGLHCRECAALAAKAAQDSCQDSPGCQLSTPGDSPRIFAHAHKHHQQSATTIDSSQDQPLVCNHQHHSAALASAKRNQHQHQRHHSAAQLHSEQNESLTGEENLSFGDYRSQDDNSSVVGHDVLDATPAPERSHTGDKRRSIVAAAFASVAGRVHQDQEDETTASRKKSSIGFRLSRLGSSAPPLSHQTGGLLALAGAESQQQQLMGAPANNPTTVTRNLRSLRENFFQKLNQLTAKSAMRQHKLGKSRSPNDKSSAQSSYGSSYEPSFDYATTSNMPSNNEPYHQETTFAETDDYEPQTSGETKESSGGAGEPAGAANQKRQLQINMGQAADTKMEPLSLPGGRHKLEHGFSPVQGDNSSESVPANKGPAPSTTTDEDSMLMQSAANNGAPINNSFDNLNLNSNKTNSSNNNDPSQLNRHKSSGCNHGVGQIKSTATSSAKKRSTDKGKTLAGQAEPQLAHHNHHHPADKPEKQMGASARSGGTISTRAYLASDNERHKRKLAKARERRATLILGLIMAAFICSWLPFFTFYVLRALCHVCRDYISPRFEAFIFWMGYCNSAINPIIYTIFNRDFRKAFRKILFRCL